MAITATDEISFAFSPLRLTWNHSKWKRSGPKTNEPTSEFQPCIRNNWNREAKNSLFGGGAGGGNIEGEEVDEGKKRVLLDKTEKKETYSFIISGVVLDEEEQMQATRRADASARGGQWRGRQ